MGAGRCRHRQPRRPRVSFQLTPCWALQRGRGERPAWPGGLGLLLPKPLPPEVEKHLEDVASGVRFWNLAPWGALGMGSFSGSLGSQSVFGARTQCGPII